MYKPGYVDYFLKIPAAVPVVDQQCEDEKGHESYVIEFESGSETPSDLDILSQPQMKTSKATQTANLDLATDVVDLRPLLDSIIRTQVEHSICLQEIKQIIVNEGHESDVEKASFNFDLACDCLEALESLETYVGTHSSLNSLKN
ncbi:hypothetical protein JTB14_035107 [Gonioctena quinquepunctata]|nr:hypothetical protein JTB14_035107 [Gonioctena quinquepunctata]